MSVSTGRFCPESSQKRLVDNLDCAVGNGRVPWVPSTRYLVHLVQIRLNYPVTCK